MSCYITLHFSNSLSPEYDFNDADTPYFASKNLIPLFWLALFSKENIHLYESHIEDEYSYYYLQTNRLNAIYNFQKLFWDMDPLWSGSTTALSIISRFFKKPKSRIYNS